MTDVAAQDEGFLNTPPMMGPPEGMSFPPPPPTMSGMPGVPGGIPGQQPTTGEMDAMIAKASQRPEPEMGQMPAYEVEMPVGYIAPGTSDLITQAVVRELTGYDEEKLSHISKENSAVYVTELLMHGVSQIGGTQPTKEILRDLLIGDRDALVLGVRKATYGDNVEFVLTCDRCDKKSEVTINLDDDVKVETLENPSKRVYEVVLKHDRVAEVILLTGGAQEAFSDGIARKTQAEIETIMLSKSVTSIAGRPTFGRVDTVLSLSSYDRGKLVDFLVEHQPGPRLLDIPVNCATCGEEYPISLGLPNMFRF